MAKWAKKIKPCPFCGFRLNAEDPDCIYPVTPDKAVWTLNCYGTGGGCGASMSGHSAEEVVRKWNRRALPVIKQ